MKIYNSLTVENVALDSAGVTSVTSPVIDMESLIVSEVHTSWTKTGVGVLAGTVSNQKSNDGVVWFEIESTVIGNLTGKSAKAYTDIGYRYFKSVITLSGGTATIYQVVNAKGV